MFVFGNKECYYKNMTNTKKTFYITTTLPYVNGKPHIGFAMEIIRADIIARHKKLLLGNENVYFNTGTDEHGQKIADEAKAQNLTPQEYVDKMVVPFLEMTKRFNISHNNFIRTTDEYHIKSAQKFWKIVEKNGYIEKRKYQTKYCVGCELEKTDSELKNGKCPEHPNREIQLIDEENYFFKASTFTNDLLKYYETNPVLPNFRLNELRELIKTKGMKDFSISRLKKKMSWGVPVPNDEDHVMYVWFDALVNYVSTLGWGSDDETLFEKFWGSSTKPANSTVFQICGKDNLRPQSAMWQSMLMGAKIKNSDMVYVNGFIISGGQKMSKSIGNVINPNSVADKYGVEAVRFFVAKHLHNHEDSDWTEKRFAEAYTADLVNGLGNLTNRILAMSSKAGVKMTDELKFDRSKSLLEKYDFNGEMNAIWESIADLDDLISDKKPFQLIKEKPDEAKMILLALLKSLYAIADWLLPVMPQTAEKIIKAIKENKKPEEPLFPRIEN